MSDLEPSVPEHRATRPGVDVLERIGGVASLLLEARTIEFLRFCVVGCSGVVVNLGFYAILTRVAGASLHVASPLAIEVSVIWNFLLNDNWTFGLRHIEAGWPKRLARFHAVCAAGGVVNYVVLILMVEAFGWWDIYANLLGIVCAIGLKFAFNSQWTWKESHGRDANHSAPHLPKS